MNDFKTWETISTSIFNRMTKNIKHSVHPDLEYQDLFASAVLHELTRIELRMRALARAIQIGAHSGHELEVVDAIVHGKDLP